MKMTTVFKRAVPLLFCMLAAGCRNDLYYQAEAVERARDYLCEEARELSAEQMMFVRQNPPVLMHGDILGKLGEAPADVMVNSEVRQICVVWRIPGAEQDYLVFGRSEPRMQFWRPERVLRRKLRNSAAASASAAALKSAREFVITSMREKISRRDLNIVRFRYPEVASISLTVAAEEKKPQTALIWYLDDGKNAVVVLGGSSENLNAWKLSSGGVFSVEELRKNRVKQISSPADFLPGKSAGKEGK